MHFILGHRPLTAMLNYKVTINVPICCFTKTQYPISIYLYKIESDVPKIYLLSYLIKNRLSTKPEPNNAYNGKNNDGFKNI